MRRFSRFRGLTFFLVLGLASSFLIAQAPIVGELSGQVKDETGAALPGATVTLTSTERGFTRTTTTDATGRFRFPEVQAGKYDVSVSLAGFSTVTLKGNLVETNKKTEVSVPMKLSQQQAEVTVTGEVPIVDKTQTSLETRQRSKEFEKMPQGRSFQALFLNAPGVNLTPGTNPNPSVHGGLSSNNTWLYDGVDTTDPTTGTFGGNLNYEAIQEISVTTSGLSAEYGRGVGGLVNVITKSGTNTFAGSFKTVMTNDNWNSQNTTASTVCTSATNCTHPSLARTKYDHINPRYAFTLGGPFWQDHIWFFGAYETADNTTGQQSTPVSLENFQQTTKDRFWDGKITAQITPSLTVSARGSSSPTSGFIVNYAFFGAPGELVAYTGQDQTSQSYAGFMTGVFGNNVTAEIQGNWNGPSNTSSTHFIDVYPFAGAGAMHYSEATGFQFNGPTFDGYVNRPRQGITGAASYFTDISGNSHNFKAGVDYQHLTSSSQFGFVNNQVFIDKSYDYKTRLFDPDQRRDYAVPLPSISDGTIIAVYGRDKFEVGKHFFFEVGLRYEHQDSSDDISRTTVSKGTVSPRISASYDIMQNGKTLIVGTYGRFYQFVTQGFSDNFGQNAQQATYDNFVWNGTSYVFSNHVAGAGSAATIPSDLSPSYVDEGTLGFRQQIGNTIGVSVTGIYRKWNDLIDDIPVLDSKGNRTVTTANYGSAERKFYGAELVFDKRFSEHWNANLNYAWGKTNGNSFVDTASDLGNYLTSNCRTTIDPTIGTNGVIPCSIVTDGANKTGQTTLSINHSIKAFGAYTQSFGPANLALGLGGLFATGVRYQEQRTMNVLIPGTTTNGGPTATYFYEQRGNETTPSIYEIDTSLEATFTVWRSLELGVKGEIFNVTNIQRPVTVNNTTWCDDATQAPTSSCSIARATFGTSTARSAFQTPRSYRLTALMRF
ncbi:MAG TPA: TonB-dependent receptor [Thermoanaerobaculia bacterium]|nr:TonB-dependent receptor [Thermoanaerobaculia bacterium]